MVREVGSSSLRLTVILKTAGGPCMSSECLFFWIARARNSIPDRCLRAGNPLVRDLIRRPVSARAGETLISSCRVPGGTQIQAAGTTMVRRLILSGATRFIMAFEQTRLKVSCAGRAKSLDRKSAPYIGKSLGKSVAALAQLVEHRIRNAGVAGSNPAGGTIF